MKSNSHLQTAHNLSPGRRSRGRAWRTFKNLRAMKTYKKINMHVFPKTFLHPIQFQPLFKLHIFKLRRLQPGCNTPRKAFVQLKMYSAYRLTQISVSLFLAPHKQKSWLCHCLGNTGPEYALWMQWLNF